MDQINFTITLNGVDVTNKCDLNRAPVEIVSALDEELDTCNLTLHDADSVSVETWQEIVISDGDGNKLFGGYVLTIGKKQGQGGEDNDYVLGCSDYGAYLERVYVRQEYEGYSDAEIIADIFSTAADLAGFDGTTYVNEVHEVPRTRFNRKTVREVLDWICEQTGAHWFMDYDKKLHYFAVEDDSAAWDVTDDPTVTTKKTVQNVVFNEDGSAAVNLVEVVGGMDYSEDITHFYSANGNKDEISLSYRYKPKDGESKIIVRRNDGGATTNLVVNPSFETSISDGWTQGGTGGTYSKEIYTTDFGTKALKIIAGSTLVTLYTGNIALAPGESITASGYVKCGTAGMAGVRLYNVTGGASLGASYNLDTDWERVAFTYKNTGNASINVRLEFVNRAADSTLEAYYDAAQLEKLAWPSAYCDGSLGTGYAWTGTANNSTSTRVAMDVWTTLTVKKGGSDELEGLDEVLYYEVDSRLVQDQYWPDMNNAVEISGRYEIPIRTRVRNQASYDHFGMWLQEVVKATEIIDLDVARMRGRAILAERAFGTTAVSYSALDPGLKAGMMQHVSLTARGIDDDYLIQNVRTSIVAGGFAAIEVSLGAADLSLVKLLLRMKRRMGVDLEWNENEVLDEVLDTYESVQLVEGSPTVSAKAGPYLWDDSDAVWDFCVWG